MSTQFERRVIAIANLRLSEPGSSKMITGYAAKFDSLSEDLGGFRERIAPGAFAKTIKNGDIRALFNHDPNQVLGRTSSGTLRLREDSAGLAMEISPPDTMVARDLMTSIKRGDISQCSFSFRTIADKWAKINGETIRTLIEVALFDVSPVTYPAYTATEVSARARAHEAAIGDDLRFIRSGHNENLHRLLDLAQAESDDACAGSALLNREARELQRRCAQLLSPR